ncbi:RES family NAD+ phosphorylase [Oscillospiraceae bacterium OttesenSCG-928-G22]|nr:RES family NAD+ phosphorylase [Oscillospiraceae bacterium OttesenSCG-928-G22]
MNCCANCFNDSEIRAIVNSLNQIGDCDFCGSTSVNVYPIVKTGAVESMINNILDLFEICDDSIEGDSLEYLLLTNWNIFGDLYKEKYEDGDFERLIQALCEEYRDHTELEALLSNTVKMPICEDDNLLNEYAIVSGWTWGEFSEHMKYQNRFHNYLFNADILESFLKPLEKEFLAETIAYRARISADKKGFSTSKMGSPPIGKRTAGRLNPDEIPIMYLAFESITAMCEVRASTYDFISIGTMKAKKNFKVINLSEIAAISPFAYGDLEQYVINHTCLTEIADEISKPLRRTDNPIEYLPTQYISEFIKFLKYDGVIYNSTMHAGGLNLAVFDESLFECVDVSTVEVDKIEYHTSPDL